MAKERIGILILYIIGIIVFLNLKKFLSPEEVVKAIAGIIFVGIGIFYEFFWVTKDKFNVNQIIDTKEIEKRAEIRKKAVGLKKYTVTSENKVLDKIKENNPTFDDYQFLSLARNMFYKYKKFMENDKIGDIELLCTKKFFELQKSNYDKRIEKEGNKRKFKYLEVGEIKKASIDSYRKDEEIEIISVFFESHDIKNDFNVVTGEKYKGLSGKRVVIKNCVDFKRKISKHDDENNNVISSDCPNCGAPTHIISSGKCQYCGEFIQIENTDWKIDDVRRT